MLALVARLCRATLVSASCTTRNSTVWTSSGRSSPMPRRSTSTGNAGRAQPRRPAPRWRPPGRARQRGRAQPHGQLAEAAWRRRSPSARSSAMPAGSPPDSTSSSSVRRCSGEGGEDLPGLVVQLAGDPRALGLLRLDRPAQALGLGALAGPPPPRGARPRGMCSRSAATARALTRAIATWLEKVSSRRRASSSKGRHPTATRAPSSVARHLERRRPRPRARPSDSRSDAARAARSTGTRLPSRPRASMPWAYWKTNSVAVAHGDADRVGAQSAGARAGRPGAAAPRGRGSPGPPRAISRTLSSSSARRRSAS